MEIERRSSILKKTQSTKYSRNKISKPISDRNTFIERLREPVLYSNYRQIQNYILTIRNINMLLPRPEHLTELDQVQGQTYMQLLQEVWTHQSQVLLTLQENKHAKGVT